MMSAIPRTVLTLFLVAAATLGDANMELKKAVTAGRFGRITLGETTCKWWRPQSYYDEIEKKFGEERDLRLGYRPEGKAQFITDLENSN